MFIAKRITFALTLAASLSLPALSQAANRPLDQLNATVAKILAPLQDAHTLANLVFKRIKTDATRALKLSLAADYKKTGPANTLELRVDHIRYVYGDGTHPTTKFKGFVGLDLTKILSQEELHQAIPELQQTLQELAQDYEDYGNAAQIKVKTYDLKQDAAGNYVSMRGTVLVHIDLSQLPQGTQSSEVPLTDALLHLKVNLSQGVKLNGFVVSNPAYYAFQENQTGLKEWMDQLLSQNPDTLQEIGEMYQMLDSIADDIVNGNLGTFRLR